MAIHKLYIDDFETINYSLIAIHTNLEDYRLAYFVNQSLSLNLKKSSKDILVNINESEINFSNFIFDDIKNDFIWNLFENKNDLILENIQSKFDLFSNSKIETSKKVYILPEFKKVDFFLKINHQDFIDEAVLINNLNKIDRISAVYVIQLEKIKNKNNLIF
jgi:hypothetical protein